MIDYFISTGVDKFNFYCNFFNRNKDTQTILLSSCATWSLTEKKEKSLDGSCTRMLRKVVNINVLDKLSNEELYGDLSFYTKSFRPDV